MPISTYIPLSTPVKSVYFCSMCVEWQSYHLNDFLKKYVIKSSHLISMHLWSAEVEANTEFYMEANHTQPYKDKGPTLSYLISEAHGSQVVNLDPDDAMVAPSCACWSLAKAINFPSVNSPLYIKVPRVSWWCITTANLPVRDCKYQAS